MASRVEKPPGPVQSLIFGIECRIVEPLLSSRGQRKTIGYLTATRGEIEVGALIMYPGPVAHTVAASGPGDGGSAGGRMRWHARCHRGCLLTAGGPTGLQLGRVSQLFQHATAGSNSTGDAEAQWSRG